MSRKATDWAWTTPARGVELLVLLALADYAHDKTFTCHPSLPRIAAKTGLGTSTVRRSLRSLEMAALIKSDVSSGGRRAHSRYELLVGQTQPQRAGNDPVDEESGDQPTQPERAGWEPVNPTTAAANPTTVARNPTTVVGVVPKTSQEPVSAKRAREPDAGKPIALDDQPSVADAHRAIALVKDHVGTQPRGVLVELQRTVAECIRDQVPDPAIKAGLTRWRQAGRRAASLADFIGEELRRNPIQARPAGTPAERIRALWQAGDAMAVARIVGAVWFDPAQPPSDPTPPREWLLDRRRAFIADHRTAAVAALAKRERRTA